MYNDTDNDTCILKDPDSQQFYRFITNGLLLNVVGVLGILGNVISMIILSRPQMRSSINYLLIGLARIDTVLIVTSILLFGLPGIYSYSGFLFTYYYMVYPQITPAVYPLATVAQTASVYLTLTVSLERFVAVCHPLRARSLCTYGRAKLYMIVIIVFSVLYNLPKPWESRIREEWYPEANITIYCPRSSDLRNNDIYQAVYINWMYLIFMYLLPFMGLAVLNAAIYRQMKADLEYLFFECKFFRTEFNCSELFSTVLTDQSVCYTFNLIDRQRLFRNITYNYGNFFEAHSKNNNWLPDSGYDVYHTRQVYPKRGTGSGAQNSLSLILKTPYLATGNQCKRSLKGFRLLIHNSLDIPLLTNDFIGVSLNYSTMVAVEPEHMDANDEIVEFSHETRKCFLSTEKPLKFFKMYTVNNCNLECLTNFTLDRCKCVNFYMPRENGTPICGSAKYSCMAKAKIAMDHINFESSTRSSSEGSCNCRPNCNPLSYKYLVSSSEWEWRTYLQAVRRDKEFDHNKFEMCFIKVFFYGETFVGMKKSKVYNLLDLFAYFGGLGGLFLGGSLLSVRKANKERQRLSRLQKREIGLATMLLCVVAVFFACNLLPLVINIIDVFHIDVSISTMVNTSNLLVTINSSVNFIIYVIFGEKFKRLFLVLFCHNTLFGSGRESPDGATHDDSFMSNGDRQSMRLTRNNTSRSGRTTNGSTREKKGSRGRASSPGPCVYYPARPVKEISAYTTQTSILGPD